MVAKFEYLIGLVTFPPVLFLGGVVQNLDIAYVVHENLTLFEILLYRAYLVLWFNLKTEG